MLQRWPKNETVVHTVSKSGYGRKFDEAKYVFLIKDDELLEKYNENSKKVSNSMKNGFDGETVCNEKYLKTKIKSIL